MQELILNKTLETFPGDPASSQYQNYNWKKKKLEMLRLTDTLLTVLKLQQKRSLETIGNFGLYVLG